MVLQFNPHFFDSQTMTEAMHLSDADRRHLYRQAGTALAICLGNQQASLPAIHFTLTVTVRPQSTAVLNRFHQPNPRIDAVIQGGRLTPAQLFVHQEVLATLSPSALIAYRLALAADAARLLTGSLAEARYVAQCEGKFLAADLGRLEALQFYGGKPVLETIDRYLATLADEPAVLQRKLAELYLSAFSLVNQSSYWEALTLLVERIESAPCLMLDCEEINALFDDAGGSLMANYSDNACLKPIRLIQ